MEKEGVDRREDCGDGGMGSPKEGNKVSEHNEIGREQCNIFLMDKHRRREGLTLEEFPTTGQTSDCGPCRGPVLTKSGIRCLPFTDPNCPKILRVVLQTLYFCYNNRGFIKKLDVLVSIFTNYFIEVL